MIFNFNPETEYKPDVLEAHIKPEKVLNMEQYMAYPVVVDVKEADVHHKNYLEYLAICWYSHYGVIVAPHIMWYTILTEIAAHIKRYPDHYRKHFTTSEGKQEITIQTAEPVELPLKRVMQELQRLVPTEIHAFFPPMSTSTDAYNLAAMVAFCDAVSPYYEYSMFLCEISKIRVMGTQGDWNTMGDCLREIDRAISPLGELNEYINKVQGILEKIFKSYDTKDSDFWQDMFYFERCGSGSQVEVYGWYRDMFMRKVKGPGYVTNYPSQVSQVEYKNLSTKKQYVMSQGLFRSNLDQENFLRPDFGFLIQETTEGKVKMPEGDDMYQFIKNRETV